MDSVLKKENNFASHEFFLDPVLIIFYSISWTSRVCQAHGPLRHITVRS